MDAFRDVLTGLLRRPDVEAVYAQIFELDPAEESWPFTDLMVPYPLEQFEECYEPVALVDVAQGTDIEAAARNLSERLSTFRSKLAWFEHPDAYGYYQR